MNIKKFFRGNPKPIIEKSLINVHTKGLHSLVFSEDPMVRLYFADADHDLWKNDPYVGVLTDSVLFRDLSIAVHPHHSALTLYPIFGSVYNIEFARTNRGYAIAHELSEYRYRSPLKNDNAGFSYVGKKVLYYNGSSFLHRKLRLRASALHTIYVPQHALASWLIVEGKPDPSYENICYSNVSLKNWSCEDLYQPMTERLAEDILKFCRHHVGL